MNVVFRVAGTNGQSAATNPDEASEKEFGKQAAAAGLVGTPGHRFVGGMRVSLYNAVEPAAVEAPKLSGGERRERRARNREPHGEERE